MFDERVDAVTTSSTGQLGKQGVVDVVLFAPSLGASGGCALLCVGCGRRVAVLFGGTVFARRHCHRLTYRSQRKADQARATPQANKLHDRLRWETGILNDDGDKPKGMHGRAFARLQAEHDAHANAALVGIAARIGLFEKRLDDWV